MTASGAAARSRRAHLRAATWCDRLSLRAVAALLGDLLRLAGVDGAVRGDFDRASEKGTPMNAAASAPELVNGFGCLLMSLPTPV
jgi:hypothetical protein